MTEQNKPKAFTLSELLVSLSVLGLIAALTLPNIFNSVKTHHTKAVAKETIQALQSSLLAMHQSGTLPVGTGAPTTASDPKVQALLKGFSVAKICEANDIAPPCDSGWDNGTAPVSAAPYNTRVRFVLHNGAFVWFQHMDSSHIQLLIDANGPQGPNRYSTGSDQQNLIFNTSDATYNWYGVTVRPGELGPYDATYSKPAYDALFKS